MASWVRYCVAVYMGLALAGAMIAPKPEAAAWCSSRPNVTPEMRRAAAEEADAKRRQTQPTALQAAKQGRDPFTSGRDVEAQR